ncbi:hypothetical protein [uncultured Jatrophihabitans sp.]|uniref:hypothetical protein n=1 Tax=uncultured Jatrophihabitans sp. TaxID=1610747 RepID=UPI0035CC9B3B
MTDFSGFEPQVGEIRALRTFRVGPGGVLYPLFSARGWVDGVNEAFCHAPGAGPDKHVPADPDCSCGFYAYADRASAGEYPHARYVLAVIACWGHVIAGTRGIRAQFARIEGLWLSPVVPAELAGEVAGRYPSARLHGSAEDLLAAHPLSDLDSYEPAGAARTAARRRGVRLGTAAIVLAGLAPGSWIRGLTDGWLIWLLGVGALLAIALVPRPGRHDVATQRRRMICFALGLWLVSPLAGAAGVLLLRLPLVQIVALGLAHRAALNRVARTFPAHVR